jgi:hypothetical protein
MRIVAAMRTWVAAVLLLCLAATDGVAKSFKLPNGGQLEFFPVGRWKLASEDVGELKIVLEADDKNVNARAVYSIATEGSDDFPTEEKLRQHMVRVAERVHASGDFVERKPVLKPFYPVQGFGYYAIMTDRKMVGLPSVPGDYKFFSLGMLRVAPGVMLKIQIMADGEETDPYQQLLGMAEGVVYTPPR